MGENNRDWRGMRRAVANATLRRNELSTAVDGRRPIARSLMTERETAFSQPASDVSDSAFHVLLRAGALLAESLDVEATIANIVDLLVPELADWGVVHLVDEEGAAQLAGEDVDPAKAEWLRRLHERYPARAQLGVAQVLRTGRSVLIAEIAAALPTAKPEEAAHLAVLRELDITSVLIAPLIARGRTLGVIKLALVGSARRYGPEDLRLVEELARQCALSVDNARLYRDVQTAEARYRALFEGAPDGMLVLDAQGRFRDANPAAAHLTGYSRDELIQMKAGDLAEPGETSASDVMAELRRGPLKREVTVRRKDGGLTPVESHATLAAAPDETRYVAVLRDISQRKAAEAEIHALNESLERRVAERTAELTAVNQELEAFSYSVSHDLRAPLRIVDGFSKIVLEDYADLLPEKGVRALGIIRDGATQMGQLIDDLLRFSRLGRQSLRPRLVEPAAIAAAVREELRAESEGREIEWVMDELPPCWADPALVKQIFANLVSNALKYTRGRTAARIEIGAQPRERGSSEQVYFVKDNGVGFDMAYAAKLFGVFQRLHRAEEYEGTGVGLALVQRIVHRHGGRIWAEGAVDRGAAFWFSLPAVVEEIEPESEPS